MASTDTRLFLIDFVPGFHRESTRYAEQGKWFDGNRVRFRDKKPENIRGYNKFTDDVVSGFARDLITWSDNNTRKYQGYGTNTQLYVTQNETQYDVTPVTTVVSVANNFYTTDAETVIKVSVTNHSVSVSDRVVFSGIDAFQSTSVNGTKAIVSVSGANVFYVSANATAVGTASNVGGTDGTISILLSNQESNNIQGLGYGAGVYNAAAVTSVGARAWNEPAEASDIIFLGAMWTLDNWGEDMIALRRGEKINYFETDASVVPVRASVVDTCPLGNYVLVSPNDRHTILYGSQEFGTSAGAPINPMTVRWADQNDFREWTPSAANTSGEVLLTEGSSLIGAIRSRNAINIWTDKAMYTQTFVGPPFIFNFTQVGSNCGLIGTHACVDVDGVSYWMGDNNFYMYDGRVRTMDCTVRRYLFNDFNMTQKEKVYAGINSEFKEIIWLYPMSGSEEPNGYVIYNYEENTWVYGKLFEEGIVTVFQDRSTFDNTITIGRVSATDSMYVYNNEPNGIYTGNNKNLSSFLESAQFELDSGNEIMFVDRIIPDYTFTNDETLQFFITTREYPNSTKKEKGPYTISETTNKINLRARGRESSVRVSATGNGGWRWGSVRLSMQADGDR
jgi:hypothetical protein